MDMLKTVRTGVDREELLALARDLIARESHPGVFTHEEAAARCLQEFLTARGVEARLQEIRPHRYNLIADLEGKDKTKTLMLTGHMDTVGDYGHPGLFTPRVRDGRLYGRGACDMKGPLAAMAEAMVLLRRLDREPPCNVRFAAVADEEFQSIGTEALIGAEIGADAAILGEPTRMQICLGNRGLEWVDIQVTGRGGHGSSPGSTVNAVTGAARLICRIQDRLAPRLARRTHPVLGPAVLNIGVIRGGNQPSTVPERCLIKLDRRWIYGESVESVYAELQELIDQLHREDGSFRASLSRDMTNMNVMEHGPVCIDPGHPAVAALAGALEAVCGASPERGAFPGWTDASLLSNFGHIPTVIFGPGDIGCAHSERECVELEDLYKAAEAYALTCLRFGEKPGK